MNGTAEPPPAAEKEEGSGAEGGGASGESRPASARPRTRKSPTAFRTISEVAEDLHVPQHVLRFWETKFPQVRPLKRAGGRRYYRPADVELLQRIATLLYVHGYTIKGVQRLLRETEGGGDEGMSADTSSPASPPSVATSPPGPPGTSVSPHRSEAAFPRAGEKPPASSPSLSPPTPGREGEASLRLLLLEVLNELKRLRAQLVSSR